MASATRNKQQHDAAQVRRKQQPGSQVAAEDDDTPGGGLLSLSSLFGLSLAELDNILQEQVLAASVTGDVATLKHLFDTGAKYLDINRVTFARGVASSGQRVDCATTPVMAATTAGRAEAVRLLLDRGADPNVQPHGMQSALCVAAQSGNCSIVRMLLDAGAWPMAGPEWQTELPAVLAAHAYWDALQQWSTDDPSGAFAKAEDYKRCFRLLLDAVARHLSRFLKAGQSSSTRPTAATSNASHTSKQDLMDFVLKNDVERMSVALSAGADPNTTRVCPSSGQFTAADSLLGQAVARHYDDMVKTLLSHGADPNLVNDGKARQSLVVTCAVNGTVNTLTMLLACGGDANAHRPGAGICPTTGMRWTPLQRAVERSDTGIAAVLLAAGADLNGSVGVGGSAAGSALWPTAVYLNEPCMRAFLAAGADANVRGSEGQTPLFYVVNNRQFDTSAKARVALLLLQAGADPKALDCQNKTFLFYADSLTTSAMRRVLKQWQTANAKAQPPPEVLPAAESAAVQEQEAARIAAELIASEEAEKQKVAAKAKGKKQKGRQKAAGQRLVQGTGQGQAHAEKEEGEGRVQEAGKRQVQDAGFPAGKGQVQQAGEAGESAETTKQLGPSEQAGASGQVQASGQPGASGQAGASGQVASSEQVRASGQAGALGQVGPQLLQQQADRQHSAASRPLLLVAPIVVTVTTGAAAAAAATAATAATTATFGQQSAPQPAVRPTVSLLAPYAPMQASRQPPIPFPSIQRQLAAPSAPASSSRPAPMQSMPVSPSRNNAAGATAATSRSKSRSRRCDDDACCVVCLDRPQETVLVPCGHVVLCAECCEEVQEARNECPMCRATIDAVLHLRL